MPESELSTTERKALSWASAVSRDRDVPGLLFSCSEACTPGQSSCCDDLLSCLLLALTPLHRCDRKPCHLEELLSGEHLGQDTTAAEGLLVLHGPWLACSLGLV